MTSVLAAHALSAGYHGRPVVRELSLHVDAGEIVALLGANGAGKTTSLLTLAGALPALGGEVRWDGHVVDDPLHKRARRGMSLVTEERSVIKALSTKDNLGLGCDVGYALELFPELVPLMRRSAGLLSGGEQQMLTLARAMARRPRVLLADELSLGLAPRIVDRLLSALRAAADGGLAVILVEQHAQKALRVSDRAAVLRRGQVVLEGSSSELLRNLGDIERSYLSSAAAGSVLADSEATIR